MPIAQPNGGSSHKSQVRRAPSDLFGLDNRTIIITGGLGSLGVSLADTLLRQHADVILTDLPTSPPEDIWLPLGETAKEVQGQLHYVSCDVTSERGVADAFAEIESKARHPIRGLVTCAGISGRSPAVDYPTDKFRRIMDINVTGTFLCATATARSMHRQMMPGSIVMLASMSGTNVNQVSSEEYYSVAGKETHAKQGVDTCAYNTSKSAVLQLARNLAAEWGNDGTHPPIRVNTYSPGYIMTPMTVPTFEALPQLKTLWPEGNMLGRMSTVEDHQSAIVFLLADGSSYMTASDLRADAGHCAW